MGLCADLSEPCACLAGIRLGGHGWSSDLHAKIGHATVWLLRAVCPFTKKFQTCQKSWLAQWQIKTELFWYRINNNLLTNADSFFTYRSVLHNKDKPAFSAFLCHCQPHSSCFKGDPFLYMCICTVCVCIYIYVLCIYTDICIVVLLYIFVYIYIYIV